MPESTEKVVITSCSTHCGGCCMIKAHVRDGVITRLETDDGEEPQLRACSRGLAYRQRVYHPDRLLYPMRRVGERGEGKLERISWDEALDTIVSELRRVRYTYGPASILLIGGAGDQGAIHQDWPIHRFLCLAGGYTRLWGFPSNQAAVHAEVASFGTTDAGNTRDSLLYSRLILMWGWNPADTIMGANTAWYVARAREGGARVVAVDPKYTSSAAVFADQWIPIRPGTDAAMLVAMAYVMIKESLQDQRFLDTYTLGFDKFKNYVLGVEDGEPKTPAWAEAITGVPADTIVNLAREYATIKPAALMAGIGAGRTAYGEQYHRAAITLAAMTGNIGIKGGDAGAKGWYVMVGHYPLRVRNGVLYRRSDGYNPVDDVPPPPAGAAPTFRSSRVHFFEVPDFILKGKAGGYPADCKLIYELNSNYVTQMANTNKIVEAFKSKKLEFFVIQEQFMTPTAKFADILLPVTTYLEKNDIQRGQGLAYYGFVNKAIEPLGECKTQLEIAAELAQRMGIPDFGPKDEIEWLRKAVLGSEIPNFEEMKDKGVFKFNLDEPHIAFRKEIADPTNNPFPTPSGKIEIYCQRWTNLNDPKLPPIPKYIEPWEGINDPLSKKYPLQLITTHFRRRANSQMDNVPWLWENQGQVVLINTADAQARGIGDGDMVKVFNDRGQMMIPARVTERIMPGVVDVPQGAWYDPDEKEIDRGGCANVLTSNRYSPGGACAFNTGLVQVENV